MNVHYNDENDDNNIYKKYLLSNYSLILVSCIHSMGYSIQNREIPWYQPSRHRGHRKLLIWQTPGATGWEAVGVGAGGRGWGAVGV